MPTPVFDSKQKFKAYGVVVACRSPEGVCENTTSVYFTKPEGTVQVAFQQQSERLPDGGVYDGNGIEDIHNFAQDEKVGRRLRLCSRHGATTRAAFRSRERSRCCLSPRMRAGRPLCLREACAWGL